jgi:hypothetical protein
LRLAQVSLRVSENQKGEKEMKKKLYDVEAYMVRRIGTDLYQTDATVTDEEYTPANPKRSAVFAMPEDAEIEASQDDGAEVVHIRITVEEIEK